MEDRYDTGVETIFCDNRVKSRGFGSGGVAGLK